MWTQTNEAYLEQWIENKMNNSPKFNDYATKIHFGRMNQCKKKMYSLHKTLSALIIVWKQNAIVYN